MAMAGCATPSTDPRDLPAGSWSLDPAHASVIWRVRHMGLSWYTGRFDRMEARLDFDPANPEAARLTAIIDTASISTGDRAFDATLAGSWFNAGRHPQLVFESDRIEITGDNRGRAHGRIAMNGREHPAMLDIEFYGGLYNLLEGRQAIGFGADLMVSRSAFGIGNLPQAIVGDTVHIRIEAEFLQGDRDD